MLGLFLYRRILVFKNPLRLKHKKELIYKADAFKYYWMSNKGANELF